MRSCGKLVSVSRGNLHVKTDSDGRKREEFCTGLNALYILIRFCTHKFFSSTKLTSTFFMYGSYVITSVTTYYCSYWQKISS